MPVSATTLLLLVGACSRPPLLTTPAPVPSPAGDTGMGATASETGDTAGVEPVLEEFVFVEPVTVIRGEPGQKIRPMLVEDPLEGSGLLAIDHDGQYAENNGLPAALLFAGPLPEGEFSPLDLWDGVSGLRQGAGLFEYAGDVDGDGTSDWWIGWDLYLGPLLGRQLDEADARAHAEHAITAGVVGNVDVDGDGHEDMIASFGYQTAIVYHGPHEGELPAVESMDDFDPSTMTMLGDMSGCSDPDRVTLFRDHLGPGRHVVGVGQTGYCSPQATSTSSAVRGAPSPSPARLSAATAG